MRGEAGLDVGADVRRAEAQIQKLERSLQGLQNARSKVDIDADPSAALAGIEKVEGAAKRLVSAEVAAKVDADITRAEANLTRIQANLEVLRSSEATPRVLVDTAKAESQLEAAEKKLNALRGARAVMEVDADTSAAVAEMDGLEGAAREAGEDAGEAAGDGVTDLLKSAMEALPVAGGVILAGVAVGKALLDGIDSGLQVEVRQDRLQALTGITEEQAAFFARQAGEAYASNFGESIESNMDTARLALQSGLLDPDATRRDAQLVINSLSGIADVLGEDVQPVAQAVTTLMSSGLVGSAEEAFDLIAAGAREGVNLHEDLLDTLTEYPALFQRLGLSGEEALGLVNQGLEGGARNSDLVADALKEFQIRATDASEASAEGFRAIGLNAEEMTAKIAAGGEGAREGLAQVLDGLRNMEDPVARNAAAVALFGTQAEDLGEALFNLDLSTAVDE
ncbi:phage tail tape measure protein [Salana multivorans]